MKDNDSKIHLVDINPNYGAAEPNNDAKMLAVDPFGENYQEDTEFWAKVAKCYRKHKGKKSRFDIEMRFRLERIKSKYEDDGKDTLFELMSTVYDSFKARLSKDESGLLASFEKQLSEFVVIMLREDYNGYSDFPLSDDSDDEWEKLKSESAERSNDDRKYANLTEVDGIEGQTTVLHIAAQRNLTDIARFYLKFYPNSVVKEDEPDEDDDETPARNPIEWALIKKNDEVCAMLMKYTLNERVRLLFEGKPSRKSDYSFHDLLREQKMKKTIMAVLDSCVDPSFPYIIQDPDQKLNEEEAWTKMGDTLPLRYHFYFQILDGDDEGKPAKDDDDKTNVNFNTHSSSALQLIADNAESSNDQDPIKHIIVRQLVRQKWTCYGKTSLIIQAALYLLFLLMLSLALCLGAKLEDPRNYNNSVDKFRGCCEVLSILFSFMYMVLEVEQFVRAPTSYVGDKYNVLDFIGILSIFIIIPTRYAGGFTVSRSISVIAFFINFLRIVKFFPISKVYGTYAKTFAKIILSDIVQFFVILTIALVAFAGSVYLAFAASKDFNDDFTNFWDVLLQEMRAIAEGKEFSDSYSGYNVVFTIFILLNMFSIIIVLSNILIGQIGYRYGKAQSEASIQNDIDKAKLITGLDRSMFTSSKRIQNYKKGIYVDDQEMIQDLLTEWNSLQQNEDVQKAIKSMLQQRILKKM